MAITAEWGGLVTAAPITVRWTDDAPAVDADVERVVQRAWDAACARRPLRDALVLTFASFHGGTLWGRFLPYRYFVAQRETPELRARLGVEAVGVTGLLRVTHPAADSYALARRDAASTQYPDRWDLVPSGGLDADSRRADGTVDAVDQLLRELREETGLEPTAVDGLHWIGLFRDAADGVWDLVWEVRVSRAPTLGAEHTDLRLLDAADLARLVADRVVDLPPTTVDVLRARRLVAGP